MKINFPLLFAGLLVILASVGIYQGEIERTELTQIIGIANNTFSFPSGEQVFDPQWAGEKIELERCTPGVDTNQRVHVAVNGDKLQVFYSTPAPANTYCWQAVEQTDPAKLAKMAQWLDYNARNAGYGILQVP